MSEKKDSSRKFFIDIQNIDIDTPEGQSYLLTQCEIALATQELTPSDLKIISKINDVVKAHKDVDMIKILQKRLDEIEQRLEKT